VAAPQIFRLGDKSPEIIRIKQRLARLGYFEGPLTEDFTRALASAVKKYQKETGHRNVDGIVGPGTWARLFEDPEPQPRTKAQQTAPSIDMPPIQEVEAAAKHAPGPAVRPEGRIFEQFALQVSSRPELRLEPTDGDPLVQLSWSTDGRTDLVLDPSPDQVASMADLLGVAYSRVPHPPSLRVPLFVSEDDYEPHATEEFTEWAKQQPTLAGLIVSTHGGAKVNLVIAGGDASTEALPASADKILEDIVKGWPDLFFVSARPVGDLVAGFGADDLEREDKLDIEREVKALASVVSARDVDPPLAIGLFGDWGVGKSFFMKEMKKWVTRYAANADKVETEFRENGDARSSLREPAYWSDVAQIDFNAWHFMDSNLWASLTAQIFDGLAEHVTERDEADSVEGQRGQLLDELKLANDEVKRIQGEIEATRAKQNEAQGKLDDVQKEIDAIPAVDPAMAAQKAWDSIRGSVPGFEQALKDLGVDTARASAEQVIDDARQLTTTVGKARARFAALTTEGNPKGRAALVLAILVIGHVGSELAGLIPVEGWVKQVGPVVGQWLTWIVGLLGTASQWLKRVNGRLSAVDASFGQLKQAKSEEQVRLEAKRGETETRLGVLRKQEKQHQADLKKQLDRIGMLEAQLQDLKVGRRLFKFIEERVSSPDYKEQLGIISLIRNDLDTLSGLLAANSGEKREAWRKFLEEGKEPEPAPTEGAAPIDRIILYIDDLDRCPPERVVEVLQAVHLLLAFKLFVVVVAVDSRWLLRSLEKGYPEFLHLDRQIEGDGRRLERGASTPQNYLEKIFQISFSIKPMNQAGFNALLGSLTGVKLSVEPAQTGEAGVGDEGAAAETKTETPEPEDAGTPPEEGEEEQTGRTTKDPETPDDREGSAEEKEQAEKLPPVDLNPPSLELTEDEVRFMEQMHGLIGTPRTVNRYVNTYRMIKSTAAASPHPVDGDYQVVLVLLALLVGVPHEAAGFLKAVDKSEPTQKWSELVGLTKPMLRPETGKDGKPKEQPYNLTGDLNENEVARWIRIHGALSAIEVLQDEEMRPFRCWARRVARYAFHPIRFERPWTKEDEKSCR
jgi:hypothetical protein